MSFRIDNIPVTDPQSPHFIPGVDILIQADDHGILISLQRLGVVKHVDGMGLTGHNAAVLLPLPGNHMDRLPLQAGEI